MGDAKFMRGPFEVVADGLTVRGDIIGFESGARKLLRRFVRDGDYVIVVGGGLGVTACAASLYGARKVLAYEAGEEQADILERNVTLNGYSGSVRVVHAVVGSAGDTWSPTGSAFVLPASDIPQCDVMEVDVEGAELGILDDLENKPRNLIVESHGSMGSTTAAVATKMESLGYEVVAKEPFNHDKVDAALRKDCFNVGGVLAYD